MAQSKEFADLYDVIVVIGHSNDWQGTLSPVAMARIKKGIELFEEGRAPFILLTSGRGEQFNKTAKAHSEWAKEELLKRLPLSPKRVLTEKKSRSTIENALYVKQVIDEQKWKRLIVVTSGYHMPRVKMIFKRVFLGEYDLCFVKASSGMGPVFWLKHRFKEIKLAWKNKGELEQLIKECNVKKEHPNKKDEEDF